MNLYILYYLHICKINGAKINYIAILNQHDLIITDFDKFYFVLI